MADADSSAAAAPAASNVSELISIAEDGAASVAAVPAVEAAPVVATDVIDLAPPPVPAVDPVADAPAAVNVEATTPAAEAPAPAAAPAAAVASAPEAEAAPTEVPARAASPVRAASPAPAAAPAPLDVAATPTAAADADAAQTAASAAAVALASPRNGNDSGSGDAAAAARKGGPPPPPPTRHGSLINLNTNASLLLPASPPGADTPTGASKPGHHKTLSAIDPAHLSKAAGGASALVTGPGSGTGGAGQFGRSGAVSPGVGSPGIGGSGHMTGSGTFVVGSGAGGSGQYSALSPTGASPQGQLGKLVIKPAPVSTTNTNTRSAANLLRAAQGEPLSPGSGGGTAGGGGGSPAPPANAGSLTVGAGHSRKGSVGNTSNNYVTEVHRTAHVTYDPVTGQYKGLPKEWEEALKKQFGLACNIVEGIWVVGYDARIPLVLVELRKQLVGAGGLTTEGVFRLAPNTVACNNVKQQLDTGTFKGCNDPHICANLIKVWFRDLPTHLLNVDADALLITPPDDEKAAGAVVTRVFGLLPEPNRSILSWLLDMCCEVCRNEKVNKMNVKALSICIAPNLYKLPAISASTTAAESLKLVDLQKRVNTFVEKAIAQRMSAPPKEATNGAAAGAGGEASPPTPASPKSAK